MAPLGDAYSVDEGKVTKLSLPEGVKAATTIPTFTSKEGTGSLLREIYLPETANPGPDDETSSDKKKTLPEDEDKHLARPYMILELTNDKEPDKSHYFRLDFLKYSEKVSDDKSDKSIEEQTDAKVTYSYLPLLRNFRYKINITKIGGPGFDTIEDAQKGSAADIQYNVFVISEDDLGEVMYDGKYTLSVTEKEFSVGKYGSQPVYKAQTTCPGGWEIEVPEKIPGTSDDNPLYDKDSPDKAGWIDFTTLKGKADVVSPVIQTILPNNTPAPRTGYFYVKAGRMRWLITVHQSDKAQLAISLWQDPEAKRPLEYIELHQHGLSVKPTAAQNSTERPVETARGYRRIYVKTDPYVDPNETTYFREGFRPVLKRAGRDDVFYFWDYTRKGDMATESPDEATLTEAYKATAGVPTSPWNQPSAGGDHRFFRYTGENNVWECIVTVERTKKPEDPFEYYSDLYDFSISDDSETTTARLTVSQVEYNVEPSDGPALRDRYKSNFVDDSNNETSVRYNAPFTPIFVLDGKEHHFYIAGNAPYKITLIDNPGGGITSFGTDRVYVDHDPDLRGEKVYFTTKKENTQVDNKSYKARFRVESLNNLFSPYVFTIDLVSAIIQPEANTYMIKRGETQGILIPVSRVNTAADYYDKLLLHDRTLSSFPSGKPLSLNRLGPNDDFDPYVVWTDLGLSLIHI